MYWDFLLRLCGVLLGLADRDIEGDTLRLLHGYVLGLFEGDFDGDFKGNLVRGIPHHDFPLQYGSTLLSLIAYLTTLGNKTQPRMKLERMSHSCIHIVFGLGILSKNFDTTIGAS
jgi:hypothetical protein